MKILKSHNDYKSKKPIFAAVQLFAKQKGSFDSLMLEADIVSIFGICILSHQWTLNPFKWHGTLFNYLAKMQKNGVPLLQLEFKDPKKECIEDAIRAAQMYPGITFVWLFNSPDLNYNFKKLCDDVVKYLKLQNIVKLEDFEQQNEIASVDL